jgi:hypothetical protein
MFFSPVYRLVVENAASSQKKRMTKVTATVREMAAPQVQDVALSIVVVVAQKANLV